MPSGRSISFGLRSLRATFQLPSPMWLCSAASRSKSMAYISVKCGSGAMARAATISEAQLVSPSAE